MYKYSVTITSASRKLYYHPAEGGCNCRSFYDGQEDLLFNLDNKHLFSYALLFQYLHLIIEGKNPLATFHSSAGRCHGVLGTTQPPTLKTLRSAWNAFARLLDLKFSESFECPVCGRSAATIICDGTLVGFRKNLPPALLQEPNRESVPITHGSKHNDRVFLRSVKGRELLMKYSGYSKDRKRLPAPKPLTTSELQSMLHFVEKDSKALPNLISSLQDGTTPNTAPHPYRKLFTELARNSPVCGTFQYLGNETVIDSLRRIANCQLNVFDSANHHTLDLLQ